MLRIKAKRHKLETNKLSISFVHVTPGRACNRLWCGLADVTVRKSVLQQPATDDCAWNRRDGARVQLLRDEEAAHRVTMQGRVSSHHSPVMPRFAHAVITAGSITQCLTSIVPANFMYSSSASVEQRHVLRFCTLSRYCSPASIMLPQIVLVLNSGDQLARAHSCETIIYNEFIHTTVSF